MAFVFLASCTLRASPRADTETRPFGFYQLTNHNITLCSYPKAGSTFTQQIVNRAAGQGSCYGSWDRVFDKKNTFLRDRGVLMRYNPNTTNIAIIRDPWTRAISQYADQKTRNHIADNTTFIEFLRLGVDNQHTGKASAMCLGMKKARFDHVIDLEDIPSFYKVSREVPRFGELVEFGWEKCTHGSASLYMPGSIASHKNKDKEMQFKLCTTPHLQEVCRVFADDYALLNNLGIKKSCTCTPTKLSVPGPKT